MNDIIIAKICLTNEKFFTLVLKECKNFIVTPWEFAHNNTKKIHDMPKKIKSYSRIGDGNLKIPGGIAKVKISKVDQENLINIIDRLDILSKKDGCFGNSLVNLKNKDNDNSTSTSDELSGNDYDENENDVQSDNSIDEFLLLDSINLSKQSTKQFTSDLIKDNRIINNKLLSANKTKNLLIKSINKPINSLISDERFEKSVNIPSEEILLQSNVILQINYKSNRKVLLYNRNHDITNLIIKIQNKFKLNKSYNTLLFGFLSNEINYQDVTILDQEILLTIPDHSSITIVKQKDIGSDKKQSNDSIIKKNQIEIERDCNFNAFSDLLLSESDDSNDNEITSSIITSKGNETKLSSNNDSNIEIENLPVETYWIPPKWVDSYLDKEKNNVNIKSYDININQKLYNNFKKLENNLNFLNLLENRMNLPIYQYKNEIINLINNNQIILISGETGSGKTTQIPSYILDHYISLNRGSEINIICTQPRRLPAISVAERVAEERCERVGNTIGYQIRLQSEMSNQTRILFMTTGVLLNRLQNPNFLNEVSHIIIDEVHERQVETDFLMAILKERLPNFPNVKLILMSATLQEVELSNYFNCPIIKVSGRSYPVQDYYLDDAIQLIQRNQLSTNHIDEISHLPSLKYHKHNNFYELIAQSNSSTNGQSILVFLSGMESIRKVEKSLNNLNIKKLNNINIYLLHSSLPSNQQRLVFLPTKKNEWKIILSTNIAETSLTIDDVTHVIDTGLMKEVRLNSLSNLSTLTEVYISRSQAKQRSGRAGRVRAGICWKLYKQSDFDESNNLIITYPVPEICRIPLEEVILQILYLNLGQPETFLSSCLTNPSINQIKSSLSLLLDINAILPLINYPLTPLGYHLARLPMDVKLGKMLLISICLQCLEQGLTLTASLCNKSPFNNPMDKQNEAIKAHEKFMKKYQTICPKGVYSDHIAVINAYNEWLIRYNNNRQNLSQLYEWCNKHYINHKTMLDIMKLRENFRQYLINARLINKQNNNTDNNNDDIELDIDIDNEDSIVVDIGNKKKVDDNITIEYQPKVLTEIEELYLTLVTICGGLSPQISVVSKFSLPAEKVTKKNKNKSVLPSRLLHSDGSVMNMHPSSLICRNVNDILGWTRNINGFIAYHKKMASSKIYVYDGSVIPIFGVILFGGEFTYDHNKQIATICGWIKIKINELHAAICKRIQVEITEILKIYLEGNIQTNELIERKNILIDAIMILCQ